MIDRIRGLLDRPLDGRHARAIVALASALTLAFAILVGLGVSCGPTPDPGPDAESQRPAPTAPPGLRPVAPSSEPGSLPGPAPQLRAQDPQDRPGSAAHRRAERSLAEHRALQHVPYKGGGARIVLVGALEGKAILRVTAGSRRSAHKSWRRFLHRYRDDGRAYRVRFYVRRRHHA